MTGSHPRSIRAFTLVEVMVGISMSIVILSVVLGVMVMAIQDSRRTRLKAELSRDAEFASQLMSNEVRQAGMGRPTGAMSGSPALVFSHRVITANASEIGVIADLPRPDAQYNAFGFLHNRAPRAQNVLAWHTENNGTCVRNTAGTVNCPSPTPSPFFADVTCNASATDRTCPWGMSRAAADEYLQVAAGDGAWVEVRVASPLAIVSGPFSWTNSTGGVRGLRLQTTFPAAWPMNDYTNPPFKSLGQTFVTSLDRVFYRHDTTKQAIVRRQCWGSADPTHADWPNATTASTTSPGNVPSSVCTPEEVIARNVSNLTITYFNGLTSLGTSVAAANRDTINRVKLVIDMTTTIRGRVVTHQVQSSVALRNN